MRRGVDRYVSQIAIANVQRAVDLAAEGGEAVHDRYDRQGAPLEGEFEGISLKQEIRNVEEPVKSAVVVLNGGFLSSEQGSD